MEVKHYFCLDNIIQGNIISAATFVCKAVKYVLLLAVYPAFILSYIRQVVPLRIAAPKTQRGISAIPDVAQLFRSAQETGICYVSTDLVFLPQCYSDHKLPTIHIFQLGRPSK